MNRWLGLALGLGLMIAAPTAQAQTTTFDTVPAPAPVGTDLHADAPGHGGKVAVMKRNGKVVYVPMTAARNMERAGAGQVMGAVDPTWGQPNWQPQQPQPNLGQNPEPDDDGVAAGNPRVKKGKKSKQQYQAGSVRQGGKAKKNR